MSATALDLLSTQTTSTLVLLSFRLGGLILIAPMYSSRTVPVMVKTSVMVVLTWLLFPAAVASGGVPQITFATALSEALIGFAIGLGAAVFIGAAEAMGDLLAVQIGLSGAAALDPMTNQSVPVLGQFANLFVLAMLLSVNAHLVMLDAVASSLRHIPVGAPIDAARGMAAMVSLGSLLFLCGLRFAAPVLAVVLLANVALAVLSRAAPSLNVLSVAFPIQIGLGLLAMVASIPIIGSFFVGWGSIYDGVLVGLFEALLGGGR